MKKIFNSYMQLFGPTIIKWGFCPFLYISFGFLCFYAFMEIPDVKEGFDYSFNNWIPEIGRYSEFIKFHYESSHVAIFAGFISAILGIAIPISLTVISSLDQKYHQGGISKEFLMEPINYYQYFILFINIVFLVVTMFRNTIHSFLATLYTVFFFLTVINFIAYILLIISYLTNAKSHIYSKTEVEINRYLDGKTD